jgi:hypothetical protein
MVAQAAGLPEPVVRLYKLCEGRNPSWCRKAPPPRLCLCACVGCLERRRMQRGRRAASWPRRLSRDELASAPPLPATTRRRFGELQRRILALARRRALDEPCSNSNEHWTAPAPRAAKDGPGAVHHQLGARAAVRAGECVCRCTLLEVRTLARARARCMCEWLCGARVPAHKRARGEVASRRREECRLTGRRADGAANPPILTTAPKSPAP